MEDMKVRKLREKLGISDRDQKNAAGRAIGPNLQAKISSYSGAGGNFVSAPPVDDAAAATHAVAGGNFVSAPPVDESAVAGSHAVAGGNFVSAPPAPDA